MSFIDISDNEHNTSEYDISESETDELYSPITPPYSPNIFFSSLHNTNSNLNNFLFLPSVPQTPPITPQYENDQELEPQPQPQPQQRVQVEIEELNLTPQSTTSSLPSPPLLQLNDNLINEPVQLNDIFSLPQLIQNLQLFSNNIHQQPNRLIRQRSLRPNIFHLNRDDILENVLQTSLEDIGGYKKVISDEGKKEIKLLEYESSKFEEKKCTITQEEFEEKQVIAQLPCNHIFNKEGILYWLENESNACPICRREFKYKEIKVEYNPENEQSNQDSTQEENLNPIENIRNRFNNIIREINTQHQRQEEEQMQQAILNSLINHSSVQTEASSSPPETPPPSSS
jgi:hypothetical protein